MIDRHNRSIVANVTLAGLFFLWATASATVLAANDSGRGPQCQSAQTVHIKGFVKTKEGQAVAGAELISDQVYFSNAVPLPNFVENIDLKCGCGNNFGVSANGIVAGKILTSADGSYDVVVKVDTSPQCVNAIPAMSVNKSKMMWKKVGMSIQPAP